MPVSGTANWMSDTALEPSGFTGTVSGADPGFVDAGGRDYHLVDSSACVDAGLDSPAYVDGDAAPRSGVPLFEYADHLQGSVRASDGQLDIGAHEFEVAHARPPPVTPFGGGCAPVAGGSGALLCLQVALAWLAVRRRGG